jgi:hypothetical protein
MSGFERRTRLQTKEKSRLLIQKIGDLSDPVGSDTELHPRVRFPNRIKSLIRWSQIRQRKNAAPARLLLRYRQTNQMIHILGQNRNL